MIAIFAIREATDRMKSVPGYFGHRVTFSLHSSFNFLSARCFFFSFLFTSTVESKTMRSRASSNALLVVWHRFVVSSMRAGPVLEGISFSKGLPWPTVSSEPTRGESGFVDSRNVAELHRVREIMLSALNPSRQAKMSNWIVREDVTGSCKYGLWKRMLSLREI